MPNLPKLTESDLRRYFSDAYYRRGRNYYHSGYISATKREGARLLANCEGSRPSDYRVEVTFQGDQLLDSRCSCPIGGHCKHVVALLLTWIHEPEIFTERIPLSENLQQRSKQELIALIQLMIEREPQLETLLDIPIPVEGNSASKKLTKTTVEHEISRALARNEYYDWDSYYESSSALETILDLGCQYQQAGEWENAQLVFHTLIEKLLVQYDELWDEEGDFMDIIHQAGINLAACLPALVDQIELKQKSVEVLFEIIVEDFARGGIDLSDDIDRLLVENSSAQDRQWLRAQVLDQIKNASTTSGFSMNWRKESWGFFLLQLDEADQDTEGFLQRATTYELHQPLFQKLVALERITEAISLAQQHLSNSEYELLIVVRTLEEAGFSKEAIELIEPNIDHLENAQLLGWLTRQMETFPEKSLPLRMLQWRQRPSMELYQTIKSLTEDQEQWSTVRTQLFQNVPPYYEHLVIRIHLLEEEWDIAWQMVNKKSLRVGRWTKDEVAFAVIHHFPEEVIDYFLENVEQLIQHRGRSNYAATTPYLQHIKAFYLTSGQHELWDTTIGVIREDFKYLPALQDELNKAGL